MKRMILLLLAVVLFLAEGSIAHQVEDDMFISSIFTNGHIYVGIIVIKNGTTALSETIRERDEIIEKIEKTGFWDAEKKGDDLPTVLIFVDPFNVDKLGKDQTSLMFAFSAVNPKFVDKKVYDRRRPDYLELISRSLAQWEFIAENTQRAAKRKE